MNMFANISIRSENTQDHATVVGVINEGKDSSQAEDTLKELESLRQDLDKVEQLRVPWSGDSGAESA